MIVQYISRRRGDNGKKGLWEGEKRETESANLSFDLDTLSTVLG
jgi:hypothetical protein